MVSNPILYTDSTGHCIDGVSTWVCVGIVLTVGALVLAGDTQDSAKQIENSNATVIDLTESVDNFIWKNIPSAFGIKLSTGGQAGFVAEGGGSGGVGVVFNWHSKQLSIIADASAQGYIGTPQVISKGGSFSSFYVYGASRNENLAGISDYTGAAFKIDRILQGGVTITKSTGLTPNGEIFIDRDSDMPVITKQISLNFGGNLVGNGADIGLVFGRSYTEMDERLSWTLKNNKWRLR